MKFLRKNDGFWGSWGAEPPGGLAENELKLSLSKGSKIIEMLLAK